MTVLVMIFVIISALIAIVSGIWVAYALGDAISTNKRNASVWESENNE